MVQQVMFLARKNEQIGSFTLPNGQPLSLYLEKIQQTIANQRRDIKGDLAKLMKYKARQNAWIETVESSMGYMELQIGQKLENMQQGQEGQEEVIECETFLYANEIFYNDFDELLSDEGDLIHEEELVEKQPLIEEEDGGIREDK